jgi:hypothetical protein
VGSGELVTFLSFFGSIFKFFFFKPFFAAAYVFFNCALAFEGDGTGDDVVEEATVVTD